MMEVISVLVTIAGVSALYCFDFCEVSLTLHHGADAAKEGSAAKEGEVILAREAGRSRANALRRRFVAN